jgi:hypothetical protein
MCREQTRPQPHRYRSASCQVVPVGDESEAFSLVDDSSDTHVKIEAFLFIQQR